MLCSQCSLCTQWCWDRVRRPADMMQPHTAVAWSHGREERCRREGCKKSPQSPFPATRGLGSAETMATLHTDEGFFHCHHHGQSGGSRWNGCHSRNATLKGGRRGRKAGWQNAPWKTNKAERLSVHLGGLLMQSVAQKSLGIFLLNTLI